MLSENASFNEYAFTRIVVFFFFLCVFFFFFFFVFSALVGFLFSAGNFNFGSRELNTEDNNTVGNIFCHHARPKLLLCK